MQYQSRLPARIAGSVCILAALAAAAASAGCGVMKTIAVRSTGDILKDGLVAFYSETDFELARAAGLTNLKLLEALVASDPENEDLLQLTGQAFVGYAQGFLEEEADSYADDDPDKAEALMQRAINFYARGQRYSERILELEHDDWKKMSRGDVQSFKAWLADEVDEDDVPALFWTAFGWGAQINLLRDSDPMLMADLPRVLVIMQRLADLDERYFFGGPRLFLGTFYAGFPQALGGDPVKGREQFMRAFELSDGKFMTARLFYAREYAVAVQDAKLFREQLRLILDAPVDVLKGQEILTVIAKRRAARLLKRGPDLFDGWDEPATGEKISFAHWSGGEQ